MKTIFTFVLSFFCTVIFAQSAGAYLGVNTSQFYFNQDNNPNVQTVYQPMQGTCQGIFVDQSKTKAKIPSFSIQHEDYQGRIVLKTGGNSTDVLYAKNSLGFGVYLLNKNFWKNFTYHSGLEVSLLLSERFRGTQRLDSGNFEDFTEFNYELNNPATFFFKNQLSYELSVSKKLSFIAQFAFLFGLNDEFTMEPNVTRSLRYFSGIGFLYDLNVFD